MYNKIFTKILDSSIWLESDPTRIVWFTFLAAMDEDGFAQFAAIANLAHRARVTLKAAEEAVRVLTSPDPNSSDPEHEGRRLERVDGGWVVLNAEKYRSLVTRAVAQEKTRERVARFRAKNKPVTPSNAHVTHANGESRSVTPSEAVSEAVSIKPVLPAKERNPLFDALARACGSDPLQMTGRAARACGVALAEIRKASPNVKEDDFYPRARRYRMIYPTAALTPNALCSHWAECDPSQERLNGSIVTQETIHLSTQ